MDNTIEQYAIGELLDGRYFYIPSYQRGYRCAENGGYPPTQNGDIRSLFWLFSLMALQN